MSLLRLQRDLRVWLHHGEEAQAERFAPSARAGLAVYQNNFRGQIVECLADSFPVTRAWIGENDFQEAIVEHVRRVPPSSWTLDAYPADFAATLDRIYPGDPEVGELARLEWMLAEAFVASDADPVAAEVLAAVDWDAAVLIFAPSLAIAPLTTNAPAIWSAVNATVDPPAAAVLPEAAGLLVWRQDETPRFRATDRAESDALRTLMAGSTFGALCAALLEQSGDEQAIAAAGRWLGQWITDGFITDIMGERICTD